MLSEDDIPEALRTPDELLGHDYGSIRKMARDGTNIAAAHFMVRIDAWKEDRRKEIDPKTGMAPMQLEVNPYVNKVLRLQAEQHEAKVARGSVDVAARLADLATLAAEEKQARIDGEAHSERRHNQTMIAAWSAAVLSGVGIIVSIILK